MKVNKILGVTMMTLALLVSSISVKSAEALTTDGMTGKHTKICAVGGSTTDLTISNISIEQDRELDVKVKEEVNPFNLKSIGNFKLTAYCPCTICCEVYASSPEGKTTSIGVGAYAESTVAVDPSKIPYGTKLYIEGVGVRIAADCGGAIQGNKLDIYFTAHDECLKFGVQNREVFIID